MSHLGLCGSRRVTQLRHTTRGGGCCLCDGPFQRNATGYRGESGEAGLSKEALRFLLQNAIRFGDPLQMTPRRLQNAFSVPWPASPARAKSLPAASGDSSRGILSFQGARAVFFGCHPTRLAKLGMSHFEIDLLAQELHRRRNGNSRDILPFALLRSYGQCWP